MPKPDSNAVFGTALRYRRDLLFLLLIAVFPVGHTLIAVRSGGWVWALVAVEWVCYLAAARALLAGTHARARSHP